MAILQSAKSLFKSGKSIYKTGKDLYKKYKKSKGSKNIVKGATVESQNPAIESAVAVYFDVIEEHSISLQSQITDNWLENNQPVNDYIANQPIVVSLRGLAGELVYEPIASTSGGVLKETTDFIKNKLGTSVINKLSTIPSLYPPASNITRLAQNAVMAVEATYKRYRKIIADLGLRK